MEEDSIWEEKPPSVAVVELRVAVCDPFVGSAIVALLKLADETYYSKLWRMEKRVL